MNDDVDIKEQALDPVPGFYSNMASLPFVENIEGGNVFDNLMRLVDIQDLELEIPSATQDPEFFFPIPATGSFSFEHDVRSGVPIIEYYETSIDQYLTVAITSLSQPQVFAETYSMDYVNYEYFPIPLKVRVYVYELLTKAKID